MHLKLILAHILIFIISIFVFTYPYGYIENEIFRLIYAISHLIIVLTLYTISGFLATNKTEIFDLKNYYIIALIGFIIWLFAVWSSPTDLDWKKGNGGVLWLIYRMYISGIEIPFNFSDIFAISTKNVKLEIEMLLILTMLPTLLQSYGGFVKIKRHRKNIA